MLGRSSYRRALLLAATSALAITALAAPATTMARDGDVIRRGACTGASDWKLKLSPEDGRIEVEFEVDQNRNGQTWNVRLKQDGDQFWSGQKTTQAPSGSFEVRKLATNRAGVHMFVGRARNPRTGEVCRGTASI
jgi:hypothetical protein